MNHLTPYRIGALLMVLLVVLTAFLIVAVPAHAASVRTAMPAETPAVPTEPLEIFGLLGVMFFLAFAVETLTEAIFAPLFDNPTLSPYKKYLMYIALVAGVIGAFIYQFDLIAILGAYLKAPALPVTPYGIGLTGLAIGKGSNYLHDAIQKFFVKPSTPA